MKKTPEFETNVTAKIDRKAIVAATLATYGVVPSFPALNETNHAEEGVDGDCVCPFASMHTTHRDGEGAHSVRIYLNRQDITHPENGGRIFFSCRHTSCQDMVWEKLTTVARRRVKGNRAYIATTPIPAPAPDPKLIKRAKAAQTGAALTHDVLEDPETLNTTEEEIMAMSPFKLKPGSAEKNPFAQAMVWVSLFPEKELLWFGESDEAKNEGAIRTGAEWGEFFANLQLSPACQEEPHLWPWPGHFSTGSSYKERDGGRNVKKKGEPVVEGENSGNWSKRYFAVCEADKLGKKEQLRLIKHMIQSPKFPVAYVLWTGNKSYHIGLKTSVLSDADIAMLSGIPGAQVPRDLVKTRRPERFGGMGFDHMALGASQPCRYPGPLNPRTGKQQRLLYIDLSMAYNH